MVLDKIYKLSNKKDPNLLVSFLNELKMLDSDSLVEIVRLHGYAVGTVRGQNWGGLKDPT